MTKRVLLVLTGILATGHIHAKQMDFSKVSAQANWVAHADLDALRKSAVGSFLLAKAKEDPEAAKGIAMLQAVFGLDMDAISSFSAFGRDQDKAIFLAKGGFDSERLQPMVELNESYSAKKHKGTVIHLIDQKTAEPKAIAFTGKDELLGSPALGFTQHALDVAGGRSPSLKPGKIHKALLESFSSPILMMAVDVKGMAEIDKPDTGPEAVIIQKADAIGLAMGESGDMLMASAILQTADVETAKHVENIARGFTSLLALGADIEPELAELLAQTKTQVSRKDQIVSMKLGIDIQTVKETIAREIEKKRGRKIDSSLD
ncbi:MAG: hypothetical protein CMI31_15030 [Opitutae bacterium]|nr:hypothetical protein [Opitutae bacterium]